MTNSNRILKVDEKKKTIIEIKKYISKVSIEQWWLLLYFVYKSKYIKFNNNNSNLDFNSKPKLNGFAKNKTFNKL